MAGADVFTDAFLAHSPAAIAQEIRTNGYFVCANALSRDFVRRIALDVERNRFGFNRNLVTGVRVERQYFLTHMLAVSRAFFEYCTHTAVLDIAQSVLGQKFRLKALRYYETYGGHKMQWHTDNKTNKGFAEISGIIFIAYVSDVDDGAFQYVKGSHKWSGQHRHSDYTDEFIERGHASDVVEFRQPAGSVIIYDSYGIHRAAPVADWNFVRKSLFFQVDAHLGDGEKVLVDTQFVEHADERTKMFLGFGLPSEYGAFPDTGLNTLPMTAEVCAGLVRWLLYRAAVRTYRAMPRPLRGLAKWLLHRKQ